MSITVTCNRPCNAVELQKVMAVYESLEGTDVGTDGRVALDNAHITVGTHGDSVALSLLGTVYGEPFTATTVNESVGGACATLRETVCKIFKVLDAPF